MNFPSILRGAALTCWLLGASVAAQAQDPSPAHLQAAREVVAAIQATDPSGNTTVRELIYKEGLPSESPSPESKAVAPQQAPAPVQEVKPRPVEKPAADKKN